MTALPPLPSIEVVLAALAEQRVALPDGAVRVDAYGDSSALSEELLALIRQGVKRAGTSLLWTYQAEDEALPEIGDLQIVVDHCNNVSLITRLTEVTVVPFCEVTAEYAAIEGEGDRSLADWRAAHWAFFSRECERLGREPTENMPLVCGVFEVVTVLPRDRCVDEPAFRSNMHHDLLPS